MEKHAINMERIYEKEVEKKLMTFKTFNKLCLTEALDPAIVMEMGLNEEEDKDSNKPKKRSTNHNDWCSPLGVCSFMFIVFLLGIGCFLMYSMFKDRV